MAKFYIYLLFCFVISICVEDVFPKKHRHSKKFGNKIVGGYDATIQEFPYQAYLLLKETEELYYECGGSIISNRYILTAAHCVADKKEAFVRVGSTNKGEGGTEIESKTFKHHPKYDKKTIDYDVGYIELSEDIDIDGINTQVIKLADEGSTIEPGTNVFVAGWGDTSENGEDSDTLRAVQVPTLSNEDCNKTYGTLSERMFCAGVPEGGKDHCQGDSGGPGVNDEGIQIGIVSFAIGCARPNTPGVYADVSALREWIREETGI